MTNPVDPSKNESGFTVIELSVVAVVLLVVTVSLFQMLDSLTRNERVQQAVVTNQERVRLAMIEIGRDIRAANPSLNPLTAAADYPTMIEMSHGPVGGTQKHIRWKLTGTNLTRSVLPAPNGVPTSTRTVLTNVRNIADGLALFRHYRPSGALIDPVLQAGEIPSCTLRVKVAIKSDVDPGPAPFLDESDFELRNLLPGEAAAVC